MQGLKPKRKKVHFKKVLFEFSTSIIFWTSGIGGAIKLRRFTSPTYPAIPYCTNFHFQLTVPLFISYMVFKRQEKRETVLENIILRVLGLSFF